MAAHGTQFHQVPPARNSGIDAFVALKAKLIFRVIPVPWIAPAGTGTFLEAERYNLLHQRQKEALLCQLLHAGRIQEFPHFSGDECICLCFTFPIFLQNFIQRYGSQDLRHMLVIALVAIRTFLFNQFRHARIYILLHLYTERWKIALIAADCHQFFGNIRLHALLPPCFLLCRAVPLSYALPSEDPAHCGLCSSADISRHPACHGYA